jgi:RNA polymerase sigma-70 factor (ECF subfamily)
MNVCFDLIKKRKKMKTYPLEKVHLSEKPKHELRMMLDEAIDALPERMRACFVLYAMEEMKQEEIARILKISVGGVKSNIFHAKNRLRACLSEL